MFINPTIAIREGWVSGIADPENQIQPNAIDFTLDRLFSINSDSGFIISESGKQMRGGDEVRPTYNTKEQMDYWHLNANSVYDGTSSVFVSLPPGVAAQLVVRSTFGRNGIFIASGLYDSGYEGHIGFAIHNRSGYANVAPGTRIGQIIFVHSESASMYEGGWNHGEGTHYTEE